MIHPLRNLLVRRLRLAVGESPAAVKAVDAVMVGVDSSDRPFLDFLLSAQFAELVRIVLDLIEAFSKDQPQQ